MRVSGMLLLDRVRCNQCLHYYITHEAVFRYGCRALDFRSRRLPMRDVTEASGQECLYFQVKPPGKTDDR